MKKKNYFVFLRKSAKSRYKKLKIASMKKRRRLRLSPLLSMDLKIDLNGGAQGSPQARRKF